MTERESVPRDDVITVVSGLPRTGTSMMMKMLQAGGVDVLTDGERTADKDNPEGYLEFERVKGLRDGDTAWLEQAKGKAVKVISALLSHLPEKHRYRVIFMERALDEVLASQDKMLDRRGEDQQVKDPERMKALYRKHLSRTQAWLDERSNVAVIRVSYNDTVADSVSAAERVNEFLGGTLHVQAMARVVNPELYRQRGSSA